MCARGIEQPDTPSQLMFFLSVFFSLSNLFYFLLTILDSDNHPHPSSTAKDRSRALVLLFGHFTYLFNLFISMTSNRLQSHPFIPSTRQHLAHRSSLPELRREFRQSPLAVLSSSSSPRRFLKPNSSAYSIDRLKSGKHFDEARTHSKEIARKARMLLIPPASSRATN